MTPRLTSAMQVSALLRRVAQEGGNAAVLARGDATAGAIILIWRDKGTVTSIRERLLDQTGKYMWNTVGPDSPAERDAYLNRRRERDSDLWLVELDVAQAERFAADMNERN